MYTLWLVLPLQRFLEARAITPNLNYFLTRMLYHYSGLSAQQVIANRQEYGENLIDDNRLYSFVKRFRQISDFWLVRLLEILTIVTACVLLILDIVLYNLPLDAGLILLILIGLIVSVYLFFFIESYRNTYQLKKKSHFSHVIRDGEISIIPMTEIVVGDIVLLQKGDIVPADSELQESTGLVVYEPSLLGRRKCRKEVLLLEDDNTTSTPRNMLLKGSLVIEGDAIAEVFAVGSASV